MYLWWPEDFVCQTPPRIWAVFKWRSIGKMTLLRQMSLACVRGKWKERTKKIRSGHTPSFWYRIPICQSLFRLTYDVDVAACGVYFTGSQATTLQFVMFSGARLCPLLKFQAAPLFRSCSLSFSTQCSCSCSFFLLSRDQWVFSISTKIGKLALRYSVDNN